MPLPSVLTRIFPDWNGVNSRSEYRLPRTATMAPCRSSSSSASATRGRSESGRPRRSWISRAPSTRLPFPRRSSRMRSFSAKSSDSGTLRTDCKRRFSSLPGAFPGACLRGGGLLRGRGAARAEGGDVAVQTRLRAQLVVNGVPVHPQKLRGSSDVTLILRHGNPDVLALERFDCLFQGDSVGDELTNDERESVVNARHQTCLGGIGLSEDATFYNVVARPRAKLLLVFESSWKS